MLIRRATPDDIPGLGKLLLQVCMVHHQGRPDLFRAGGRKYSDQELEMLVTDDTRPIFVAADEHAQPGDILGYAFCVQQYHEGEGSLTDIRTLYIDDLCVDEQVRGQHVGSLLYEHVLDYARVQGCHNVTLNVWVCNESALRFYEHLGLKPQKIGMEVIL